MQSHASFLSRRQFFRAAGLSSLALGLESPRAFAQEKQPAQPLAPLNRFPRAVQEWYVERVRAAEKIGTDLQAKLKTKADAEAYVKSVREKITKCFGTFPEKTPLNAKVTGTLVRDAYSVECQWSAEARYGAPVESVGSVGGHG